MQVIQDNLNLTNGYHVFETPEDICINSQLYDKITMEPKACSFFNTNKTINNKNLLLYECNILEESLTMVSREHDYEYYIQDSMDSSIFYYITELGADNWQQCLCKVQKIDNGWKLISSISPDSGYRVNSTLQSTPAHYKLLGQTDDYIIMLQNTGAMQENEGAYYTGYYGIQIRYLHSLSYIAVKKSNMSAKSMNIGIWANYSVFKIKEFADSIWLLENLLGGYLQIIKYEPETNVRTIIHVKEAPYDGNSVGTSNIILFNNKYYVLAKSSSSDTYSFYIFDIDFKNRIVTNIEKKLPALNSFPYHVKTANEYDCSFVQINLKNVDDKYISVSIHDNRNQRHLYAWHQYWSLYTQSIAQTVNSAAGYHRHAIYKYNSNNDSWSGVTAITPERSNQHIYGVIYYNQYTPIFLLNTEIIAYKFDLETEKYNKCFQKSGTFYTIGLDENNNFYTFDNSNVCKIYNDITSYLLDAEFEKSSYIYNNADISTYVKIYSKNFINEYIQTKVKVIIEGSCYFTENNKKEIITYTDSTGVKNIQVTVTKGGTMYCYIKEVE